MKKVRYSTISIAFIIALAGGAAAALAKGRGIGALSALVVLAFTIWILTARLDIDDARVTLKVLFVRARSVPMDRLKIHNGPFGLTVLLQGLDEPFVHSIVLPFSYGGSDEALAAISDAAQGNIRWLRVRPLVRTAIRWMINIALLILVLIAWLALR